MKEIKLTQGQFALVDDKWFDYVNQWSWQAQWSNGTQSYYAVHNVRGSSPVHMSNIVMNTPEGMICDHIDHNTLNNQEYNLRNVSNAQNQWNSKTRKDNKLQHKNIRVQKSGTFQVRMKAYGKVVFDKTFKTLDDAIAARDLVAKEFHGDYAYTGEPQ